MTMEPRMHEWLCAYALGEADAAQKIEVERALAASAELRAELERIEATIGLVRTTMGGGETMSAEASAALMSAVQPQPRRSAWYSQGWARMAAGFLVIGGSAIALRMLYQANLAHWSTEELAKCEEDGKRLAEERKYRFEGGAKAEKEMLAAAEAKKQAAAEWKPADPSLVLVVPDPPEVLGGLVVQFQDSDKLEEVQATETVNLPPVVLNREAIDMSSTIAVLTPELTGTVKLGAEGTYKGPGDSIAPGAGGGGGPATPAAGRARASGPASGGPPAASDGKRTSGDDLFAVSTRKAGRDLEAKNKEKDARDVRESLERRVQDFVKPGEPAGAPAATAATAAPAQRPPAEEAQVRLHALLEKSDRDEAARFARLKEGELRGLGYIGPDADVDNETRLRQLYFQLDPEQRRLVLDDECRRVFDGCRRRPHERPRDMFFRYWGDNPFEIAALDPLSTFAADVDTASYTLARRYLVEGKLPEKAQIRTEEFVNYFKADVPPPTRGTFSVHSDLAPSRFAQPANGTWTLRVVVRGEDLAKEERKPLNLTCVIDCSGSMREQNRMETVKDTLRLLLTQLDPADSVGIVAFSTEARQILPLTSVANRGLIEVAIGQLAPDGWTNSEAGLRLGYETALAGLSANATNRVVFLSDGVANKGITDPSQLSETLRPIREKGVYLNTIGVGMNNHNDALLEQLADKGDGMCSYVDDMREAKRVMIENFMGSVETIARDVKIQVDFDPAQVTRYRLLGYENRAVADADFRNDKVDAGEIGAGHQVTALYELERNLAPSSGGEKPLATVRLRWKAPRLVNGPANEEATEVAFEVRSAQQTSFEGAPVGYRRAVIVGQFAEFLRRSVHARGRSLDDLLAEAHKLGQQIPADEEFKEFTALAERSKELILRNIPGCDELCQAIDAYRTWQFQCAQAELLDRGRQQQLLDDLARQNRDMEERIREILRRRLESSPK